MGIEKFFSTLYKNFNIIKNLDLNNNNKYLLGKILLLDFNSIIHNVSSNILIELNNNDIINNLSIDEIEYRIIENINKFIILLLNNINNNKLKILYIGLDGIPSFSKILEQKKRRYMGELIDKLLLEYPLKYKWSKNNITPGTLFMNKINLYLLNIKKVINNEKILENELILKMEDYEYYKENIKKIIISDTNKKGEAEMKIMKIISKLKPSKKKILFYSPDADVILLSMISEKSNNINILKYDNNTNILYLINIKKLKNSIFKYCKNRCKKNINVNNLINDIVFIFTIFGNDFIPHLECINTNYDFLLLIDLYLINYIDQDYIINQNNINIKNLYYFFKILKNHEKRLLLRNSYLNLYQNYNYANQKNFYIDYLNLSENIKESYKFGNMYYNFYNNILLYIDPYILKNYINNNKYGCLNFYLLEKHELYKIIIKIKNDKLQPFNKLFIINYVNIDKYTKYDKLFEIQYTSNTKKHIENIKNLNKREQELYLINNKLDKYTKIFNPQNKFYLFIQNNNDNNNNIYNKLYFNDNEKQIVKEYLLGLKWIFTYYYIRKNINELWYYPYYKAPLLSSIINYYDNDSLNLNLKKRKLNINSIEQLIYITPIDKTLNSIKSLIDIKVFDKIKLFLIDNLNDLFYNLSNIYNTINNNDILDCSISNFISKCNYKILNNIININKFKKKFRKYYL